MPVLEQSSESDPSPVDGATYKDPLIRMHVVSCEGLGTQDTEQVRHFGVWELFTFWWRHLVFQQGYSHSFPAPGYAPGLLYQDWQGGRLANLTPQLQARDVISSPNEVPWGPSHNWISGSKGIHLDISKYPQGLVLASDPHRHPLMGATHQATFHSCLASSGILCTFFKPC